MSQHSFSVPNQSRTAYRGDVQALASRKYANPFEPRPDAGRRDFLLAGGSLLVGCGDGLPRAGSRVQYIPKFEDPIPGPTPDRPEAQAEEAQIANLKWVSNPKDFALRAVGTDGAVLIAAGDPDGADAYLMGRDRQCEEHQAERDCFGSR